MCTNFDIYVYIIYIYNVQNVNIYLSILNFLLLVISLYFYGMLNDIKNTFKLGKYSYLADIGDCFSLFLKFTCNNKHVYSVTLFSDFRCYILIYL